MTFPYPPSIENQFLSSHVQLLNENFHHFFGYPLLDSIPEKLSEQLFYAPFAVLSHNTDADPILNYANQKALSLFELDWQQLINLPSRQSAETINQAARDKLMAKVTTEGFVKDYQGIRVSSQGRRFQINDGIIWNLYDKQGIYQGQAACFSDWLFL
jgi:hypothetical protein